MVSTQRLTIAEIQGPISAGNGHFDLRPPPRFRDKTFATYQIDPQIHGQAEAVAAVQAFAQSARRRITDVFRRRSLRGCYLDGDFGVGKTHLLAAAWHAAPGSKHYLSFSEAMSIASKVGAAETVRKLDADLVCIDEFELDDPSNTRLADLICHGLTQRGCRLLVTSNTVPGELGAGRLFVSQFRAQLVRIGASFSDIHVPGVDYRQRLRGNPQQDPPRWYRQTLPPSPGHGRTVMCTAGALDRLLAATPVIHLRRLGGLIDHLVVEGVDTFADQLQALRFVHLVDRLYDHHILLSVQAQCALEQLFHPEYRDWAFAKKYRRCLSRLVECCSEPPPDRDRPHQQVRP